MKKITTIVMAMLMLLSMIAGAFAEEAITSDTAEPSATDVEAVVENGLTEIISEETVEAGTAPDSPILWGLDRALERIDLALTFNKAKKIEKRLVHARERLLEVQAMVKIGKLKHAAKAAEVHAEEISEAETDLGEAIESDGETDKLKTFEARFDKHIQVLERVQAKLQEKGIEAPGIANALAIAKAKKSVVLARQAVKEARKSGEGLEAAKAGLDEARDGFEQTRDQIRENKRFVRKAVEEAKEEVAGESSEETTTETSETSESTEENSETITQ